MSPTASPPPPVAHPCRSSGKGFKTRIQTYQCMDKKSAGTGIFRTDVRTYGIENIGNTCVFNLFRTGSEAIRTPPTVPEVIGSDPSFIPKRPESGVHKRQSWSRYSGPYCAEV